MFAIDTNTESLRKVVIIIIIINKITTIKVDHCEPGLHFLNIYEQDINEKLM